LNPKPRDASQARETKESATRRGRIALFYPYGVFGTVQGLLDAVRLLADAGYEVDVFYRATPASLPDRLHYPGVTVTDDRPAVFTMGPIGRPKIVPRRAYGVYRRLTTAGPHRWWRRFAFLPELRRRHRDLPYTCFMGLDWHGLLAAGPLAAALNVPLVYWSLELMFRDDLPYLGWESIKEQEVKWSQEAAFTIIQDEWRASAFADENGVDPSRIVVVPNAQRGKARRSPSRLLRDRYGIDASQRIVLCTGYLRPWAMSLEIVEAARAWPAEYVLYVQSKVKPEGDDESPYSDAVIRAAESRNVIIGLDPVPADQFQELVDAADVGIALYNPLSRGDGPVDRNMELMGYSSGKLADYLHAGLPVIVNPFPGPRDLVEGHKCGICVDGAGELAGALDVIFRDYGRFSSNACRCFDEVLDLDRSFPSVLARLEELEPET
jgi:glycosyltransferase involved in cell wall biosynthesis